MSGELASGSSLGFRGYHDGGVGQKYRGRMLLTPRRLVIRRLLAPWCFACGGEDVGEGRVCV